MRVRWYGMTNPCCVRRARYAANTRYAGRGSEGRGGGGVAGDGTGPAGDPRVGGETGPLASPNVYIIVCVGAARSLYYIMSIIKIYLLELDVQCARYRD